MPNPGPEHGGELGTAEPYQLPVRNRLGQTRGRPFPSPLVFECLVLWNSSTAMCCYLRACYSQVTAHFSIHAPSSCLCTSFPPILPRDLCGRSRSSGNIRLRLLKTCQTLRWKKKKWKCRKMMKCNIFGGKKGWKLSRDETSGSTSDIFFSCWLWCSCALTSFTIVRLCTLSGILTVTGHLARRGRKTR